MIEKCSSLNRICAAMKYYDSICNKNASKDILIKFCIETYTNFFR